MKKILKLTMLSAVLLMLAGVFFLTTCKRNCDTSITKPDDLLPIDKSDYNDVYTVWWNYRSNNGIAHEDLVDKKNIKIYGVLDFCRQISVSGHGKGHHIEFRLKDEYVREHFDYQWQSEEGYIITIIFPFDDNSVNKDELLEKMDIWNSQKKRFYFVGSLRGGAGGKDNCPSSIYPYIILNSLDDIYFEEN